MTKTGIPNIVNRLLANHGENIHRYFRRPKAKDYDREIWKQISKIEKADRIRKWISDYRKKATGRRLDHDVPWVTLVALYGLFGNQGDSPDPRRCDTLNQLFQDIYKVRHGKPRPPQFERVESVLLEVKLPEISRYRRYIRDVIFKDEIYHLYPDRTRVLERKVGRVNASFEGNTNLDALISGNAGGRHIHIFIEAKLMSDISKDITYVPVRNQIARNIDCAIDLMTNDGKDLEKLKDFWFVLLTPGIFKTEKYGGRKNSPLSAFFPDRGRLYCYKMDDYLIPEFLKRDLPHWEGLLDDKHWQIISDRIGWLSYEDIVEKVISNKTLQGDLLKNFTAFFEERSLV